MTRDLDIKRAFDLVVAGSALVVLSPLLVGIAVAVRVTSPGPALFRQERVGQHGRHFRIHKFRTMRTGASGSLFTTSDDARITKVGAFLRRTKLDELPQLIDVVRGDMSLVGPRPEVPSYVELWDPSHREIILSVRPGITDPATVLLRNEGDELAGAADPARYYTETLLPRKTAAYAEYVRSRTFVGDLQLLLATVGAVTRGGHQAEQGLTSRPALAGSGRRRPRRRDRG